MEVNCFFPPHNSNRGLGGANQEDSRLINSVAGPSVALPLQVRQMGLPPRARGGHVFQGNGAAVQNASFREGLRPADRTTNVAGLVETTASAPGVVPPVVRPVREVARLHYKRVALPAAARFAVPLRDVRVRAPVQRDDAPLVEHLVEDHDMLRGLEDLVVRVVAEPDLRQAVAEAAHQTARPRCCRCRIVSGKGRQWRRC